MNTFLFAFLLLIAAAQASASNYDGADKEVKRYISAKPIISSVSGVSTLPLTRGSIVPRPTISSISSATKPKISLQNVVKLAIKVKLVLEAQEALIALIDKSADNGNMKAEELLNAVDHVKNVKQGISGLLLGKELVQKLEALNERKQDAEDAAVKKVSDTARNVISGKTGYLG